MFSHANSLFRTNKYLYPILMIPLKKRIYSISLIKKKTSIFFVKIKWTKGVLKRPHTTFVFQSELIYSVFGILLKLKSGLKFASENFREKQAIEL